MPNWGTELGAERERGVWPNEEVCSGQPSTRPRHLKCLQASLTSDCLAKHKFSVLDWTAPELLLIKVKKAWHLAWVVRGWPTWAGRQCFAVALLLDSPSHSLLCPSSLLVSSSAWLLTSFSLSLFYLLTSFTRLLITIFTLPSILVWSVWYSANIHTSFPALASSALPDRDPQFAVPPTQVNSCGRHIGWDTNKQVLQGYWTKVTNLSTFSSVSEVFLTGLTNYHKMWGWGGSSQQGQR